MTLHNRYPSRLACRTPHVTLLAAFALTMSPGSVRAQAQTSSLSSAVPAMGPSSRTPGAQNPSTTPAAGSPSAISRAPANVAPPEPQGLEIKPRGPYRMERGSIHLSGGISVSYQGFTLSSDTLDGDPNRELVFSG